MKPSTCSPEEAISPVSTRGAISIVVNEEPLLEDISNDWFYTDEWQAGEVEASRQLANGEGVTYDTAEDFLADLP